MACRACTAACYGRLLLLLLLDVLGRSGHELYSAGIDLCTKTQTRRARGKIRYHRTSPNGGAGSASGTPQMPPPTPVCV